MSSIPSRCSIDARVVFGVSLPIPSSWLPLRHLGSTSVRHPLRVMTLSLMAVLALLVVTTASAQDDMSDDTRARSLFNRGQQAHDEGRYEDALQDFEAAYALSGRPALLFNIGTSSQRLGWNDRALGAYRRYLREQPQASNRGDVEARISRIEAGRAPTPRQTAEAGMTDAPVEAEDDEGGVTSKWWSWVGVAALVAGGVVLALLLTSEAEAPMNGDFGPDGHVSTLRSR